ncbi:hypothetical protein M426DRAFT_28588 [Hypoxylon sp. CI-4A]|nr:hypothetical protein M426DRAFT_28588 [Hypoxylon sp. CI-4A]
MDKRETITASNLGPIVSLLTWIMTATVLLAVAIKFTLSSIIPGRRNSEDVALILATIFSVGFTVSISLAVPNGIGRHQDTLSSYQLESMRKAIYAADILFILVSTCAQASVLFFLHEVTPELLHRRTIYGTAALIILVSTSSIFVAAFSCPPPDVWRSMEGQCIDQLSFWEAFAGINLFIESILVLLPILIVYPLLMGRIRKIAVVSYFAVRLLVIGAFVAQICEAQSLKPIVRDRTFHAWKLILTMVFVQALSIITVCIPYIRTVLLVVESGMIQTGHLRLQSRHGTEPEIHLQYIPASDTCAALASNRSAKIEEPPISYGVRVDNN